MVMMLVGAPALTTNDSSLLLTAGMSHSLVVKTAEVGGS